MNVGVFGSGYVGLVSAACLAEVGHDVTCVDVDAEKVKRLSQGDPVIYEPGLADLLERNKARLHFTTDAASGVRDMRVVIIAVGTPQDSDGKADLRAFFSAARTIATHARDEVVVVDKSTVPVGTAAEVEKIFHDAGKRVHVVSNPETLREGTAIHDFMSPDRIIVGARSSTAFAVMRDLYSPFLIREDANRILEMSPESAEIVKYASNSMLAQRVSFVNFLSQLCAATGADIRDVRRGVGSDKRIGMQFLYPGPGFGGSCFPKDVHAFAHQARAHGVDAGLLEATLRANEVQQRFVQKLVLDALGEQTTVAVWGLAFKAKTDDARSSPSIPLVKALLKQGKRVLVHDPQALENFLREVPQAEAQGKDEMLSHAAVLVVMTEWDEYRTLSDEELTALRGKTIVDCRNILAREVELSKLKAHGIRYVGIGIPP